MLKPSDDPEAATLARAYAFILSWGEPEQVTEDAGEGHEEQLEKDEEGERGEAE